MVIEFLQNLVQMVESTLSDWNAILVLDFLETGGEKLYGEFIIDLDWLLSADNQHTHTTGIHFCLRGIDQRIANK